MCRGEWKVRVVPGCPHSEQLLRLQGVSVSVCCSTIILHRLRCRASAHDYSYLYCVSTRLNRASMR